MHIEIREGLKEGDEVITGPFNVVNRSLKDSTLVKIVNESELYSGL
jgi:HlyD family secretion protein